VTAHFIDDWELKNILLLLADFPAEEKHSGANIIEGVRLIPNKQKLYSKPRIGQLLRCVVV